MQKMKTTRGISESSTTSDNTTEFIDIVKKYDVVYNTHNPDYKNVEVKMKVWSQIAEEIGLSVDASKRKWKNLRDSYTKYLRSFRIGTKTSKKYQYWAHADHMEFLKPYQGPGRNSTNNNNNNSNSTKINDEEETECDLGYQVLAKASTSSEEDVKVTMTMSSAQAEAITTTATTSIPSILTSAPINSPIYNGSSGGATSSTMTATFSTPCSTTSSLTVPIPTLPTVQLPPQLSSKPLLGPIPSMPNTSLPAQIFPLPPLTSATKTTNNIPMPSSSSASSVGCLIIEPHLFASAAAAAAADTFKKEFNGPALSLFHSLAAASAQPTITAAAAATTASSTAISNRVNPPLITKIRRVQPSPQTAAINLSFSAAAAAAAAQQSLLPPLPPPPPPVQPLPLPLPSLTFSQLPTAQAPPPAKVRKLNDRADIDINAILQANRDLDANTLFFLSLSRMVRLMPTKFQSLAKMRCMRIVSDIELELENFQECHGMATNEDNKYSGIDSPSPPDGATIIQQNNAINESATEHFVYVMSPSRLESMIDISSDDEATMNGN